MAVMCDPAFPHRPDPRVSESGATQTVTEGTQ